MSAESMPGIRPAASAQALDQGSWGAVWSIALAIAALNASEMLPASLLTPMASSLQASEGLIGQSVTATAILAIITSLLIAPLTSRFDRRPILLVLGVALVVSNVIVALAPNAGIMLAARLVLGATVGGVWGLAASLAMRLVPAHGVAKALSIIFGGASVAAVAAAPLGAFFGEMIGWRGVFLAVAGVSTVAGAAQFFTLPSMPPVGGTARVSLWRTLRLPWMLAGMAGVMLFWGGAQTFTTYVRPYLEAVTGIDANGVSIVLLVFGLASLVGTVTAGPLLQKSLRRVLPLAAAVEAVALGLLLVFGQSWLAAIVFVAFWGLAMGLTGVGWSTWVTRTFPDHAESAGGVLVAFIQGSMMLGALIGGALIDGVGPIAPLTVATFTLLAAAIYSAVILHLARPAITANGGA